jgi:hypothetical protein
MMVSGVVLIVVFILTLVFGIIRIVNAPSQKVLVVPSRPRISLTDQDSSDTDRSMSEQKITSGSDIYLVAEDVTKLIIELVFILFAILGTFILHRYVKAKYSPVSTNEPTTAKA